MISIRSITTGGTHNITSSDDGKLIVVSTTGAEVTLQLASALSLGSGFACEIYKKSEDSSLIHILPASGETFDGATQGIVPITHESVRIVSDGSHVLALSNWRRNEVMSHRTVATNSIPGTNVWNIGLKDMGLEVRVDARAAGGEPAKDITLQFPNTYSLISPAYRSRKIVFRRVDDSSQFVQIAAASGESINQSSTFALNGLNTYAECFVTTGQIWAWGVDRGWGNPY